MISAMEHLQHLEQVFQIISDHEITQLYAKQSKCRFMKKQVAYMGCVISQEGVAVDMSKVSDMLSWPLPQHLKALRRFLGLTSYWA